MEKIDWFWFGRRNASLFHLSAFMHGLKNDGWLPVVDFTFDNQIVIGVPGKGCYIFYDRNQLSADGVYRRVWKSIDENENFVTDFREKSDELFGYLYKQCDAIENTDFTSISDDGLRSLYSSFIEAWLKGPIITVQLWGIEACLDPKYKIRTFLEGKPEEYLEILSTNTGETVAYTEQKDLLSVISTLQDNEEVKELFTNDVQTISRELNDFEKENKLFEKHCKKYEWMNVEYVSGGWSRQRWLQEFKEVFEDKQSATELLEELERKHQELISKREELIQNLNPPKDVLHSLDALEEFIAQRDWSKGNFTKIFLSLSKLLEAIALRLDVSYEELLHYSYQEVFDSLKSMNPLEAEKVQDRIENGFGFKIIGGELELVDGKENIQSLIEKNGLNEPFSDTSEIQEFSGLPASRGVVEGVVRVLEDASKISDMKDGEILVTYMTTIEFIPAFRKAVGVITDEGGMSSHAAITAREFSIPCITSTKIATRALKTGDRVRLNGAEGSVTLL